MNLEERSQLCRVVVVAKSRPSVDWEGYFSLIKKQCPWSYVAWHRGLIDIVEWTGQKIPLGDFQARMYLMDITGQELESLTEELDKGEDEWLFSYPGYGIFATPVPVIIQQNRANLNKLREQLGEY